MDAQLDLERDLQREAGRTPDYGEGVSAFLEKRKPAFTGRILSIYSGENQASGGAERSTHYEGDIRELVHRHFSLG